MEKEKWKEIEEYKGRYEVSTHGRVRSMTRRVKSYPTTRMVYSKIRSLSINRNGYSYITLKTDGECKALTIHRLVAIAFINNPKNKPCVNHINGVKTDNSIENLEWCTHKENIIHAHKNNLINIKKGESHHFAKLKNKEVLKIRDMFNNGMSQKDISITTGVCCKTIHQIVRYKTFKDV